MGEQKDIMLSTNEKYKLTDEHFKVLTFIVEFKIAHDGCSPSLQEIADACDISSKSVVLYKLKALEYHEKIVRLKGARGIKVVGGKWGLLISHMIGRCE